MFNIIYQNDTLSTLEIARDSKTLALATQRDSTSMKTLAVVTMVFLPGTFTASIFAMPLFDWDAQGNVAKPKLYVYFAVTLPLTMVTFGIWLIWTTISMRLGNVENKVRNMQNKRDFGPERSLSEIEALSLKRNLPGGSVVSPTRVPSESLAQ